MVLISSFWHGDLLLVSRAHHLESTAPPVTIQALRCGEFTVTMNSKLTHIHAPEHMPLPPVLDRFLQAQEPVWPRVIAELRAAKKRTHWMWFVFPQIKGLGHSDMAQRYAIQSLAEAQAYLAHPVLARRLHECCQILLGLETSSALDVLGSPDDLKLRSSMTLFGEASAPGSVFDAVLQKYFGGHKDPRTMELIVDPASIHLSQSREKG